MKILLIPNAPRMTARHYCLAKSLVAGGHEVEYVMWELPYTLPPKEMLKHLFLAFTAKTYQYESFTVHKFRRLPFYWPFINGWLFKRQLRTLFDRSGADIIFNETYTNETEAPRDLPYIYDLADDYAGPADVFGSKLYKLAFKLLDVRGVMRRQCQHALAVTVVSQLLETYARQYNHTVVKLPNGIDASVVRSVLKTAKQTVLPHSLVYASGFGRWSRVVPAMQAVTKLRTEFPDIRLTLIGDGTEVENIKAYIREHDAESYIDYKGFVSGQNELFSLINQSAIGLNSSDKNSWRDASFPMKLIDYSSLGKPVLSTDLVEVKNLGFENVSLFSNDGDGLVDAARKLLQTKPKTYSQLSEKVLQEYDWSHLTSQLIQLSESVLDKAQERTIVHVTPSYPPRLGGLEKVVQVLATTQQSLGHTVRVITSDHGAKDFNEPEDFPVSRLKSFGVANTTIVPGLLRELRQLHSTDMVHLHVTQAFTPEMVWLAAKSRHFPYVAHIHIDAPPSGPAGFLLKLYKPLFLKRVLRNAGSVVVFTEDQKLNMQRQYGLPPEQITVMPNGVEDKFYYEQPRKPHPKPRLLFVGRLSYQKNLPLLLEALKGVSERFQTDLIGDGEDREQLATQAKQLRLQNVTFVGRLDGEALLDRYRHADMFVLPSEREGMPLVLLEAMAMGLPVVATDVTGSRDVIVNHKNGLLVPFGDAAAFRKALLEAGFSAPLYTQLHTNALAMSKQYSWHKIALRFDTLYEAVS